MAGGDRSPAGDVRSTGAIIDQEYVNTHVHAGPRALSVCLFSAFYGYIRVTSPVLGQGPVSGT